MRHYTLLLIPTLTIGTLVGCNTVGDRYTNGTLQNSTNSTGDSTAAAMAAPNTGTPQQTTGSGTYDAVRTPSGTAQPGTANNTGSSSSSSGSSFNSSNAAVSGTSGSTGSGSTGAGSRGSMGAAAGK